MCTPGIPLVRFSTRGTRVGGVHRTDGGYISRFVSLNSYYYWLMNHKYINIDIIIKRALLDTTNTV